MKKTGDNMTFQNKVTSSHDIKDNLSNEDYLNQQNQTLDVSLNKRSYSAEGTGKRTQKFRIIKKNEMNENNKFQVQDQEIWSKKIPKVALKRYNSAFPKDFFANVQIERENLQQNDNTIVISQKILENQQSIIQNSYKVMQQYQQKDFQNNHHKLVSQLVNQQNQYQFPLQNINTQKQLQTLTNQQPQQQSYSYFLQSQSKLNKQLQYSDSKQRCQSEADSPQKKFIYDDVFDKKNIFEKLKENEKNQQKQQFQEQQQQFKTNQQKLQYSQLNFNKQILSHTNNFYQNNNIKSQSNGNNSNIKQTNQNNQSAYTNISSIPLTQKQQFQTSNSSYSHRSNKPLFVQSKFYCKTEQNEDSLKQLSDYNLNQSIQSIYHNDTPKFINDNSSHHPYTMPAQKSRQSSFTSAVLEQLINRDQNTSLHGEDQQSSIKQINKQDSCSEKKQLEKDKQSSNSKQLYHIQIKQKRKTQPMRSQSEQKLSNLSTSQSQNLGVTQVLNQNTNLNKSNCSIENKQILKVINNHASECQSAPEHKDNLNYATFSSALMNTFMKQDQNNHKISSFNDKSKVNSQMNKVDSNEQKSQSFNKPENADKILSNQNQSYFDVDQKTKENKQNELKSKDKRKKISNVEKSISHTNFNYENNFSCEQNQNSYYPKTKQKTEEQKQDQISNITNHKDNIFINFTKDVNDANKPQNKKIKNYSCFQKIQKVITDNTDKPNQSSFNDTNNESYSNEFMEDDFLKPIEKERKINDSITQIKTSRRRSNNSTPIKSFPFKKFENSDDNSEEFLSSHNLQSGEKQKISNKIESCHNIESNKRLGSISSFSQLLKNDQLQQDKKQDEQKKRVRRPKSYHSQQVFNLISCDTKKVINDNQRKRSLNKSSVVQSNKDNTTEDDLQMNENNNINNKSKNEKNSYLEQIEQSIVIQQKMNNGSNLTTKQNNNNIEQIISNEQNSSNRNTILPKIYSNQYSKLHQNIIKTQLNNRINTNYLHKNKNDDSPIDSDSTDTLSSSNVCNGSKRTSIQYNIQNNQQFKLSEYLQSNEKQRYQNSQQNENKNQIESETLIQSNQIQQPSIHNNKMNSFLQSNLNQNLFEFSFRNNNKKEQENKKCSENNNSNIQRLQNQQQEYSNFTKQLSEQQVNNLKLYNLKLNLNKQSSQKDSSNSKISSSDLKQSTKFFNEKKLIGQTLKTDSS